MLACVIGFYSVLLYIMGKLQTLGLLAGFDCKHIESWHKIVSVGNLTPEILMTAVNHPFKNPWVKPWQRHIGRSSMRTTAGNSCSHTVSLATGCGFVCVLNTACDHSCNSVLMSMIPVRRAIPRWMRGRAFGCWMLFCKDDKWLSFGVQSCETPCSLGARSSCI